MKVMERQKGFTLMEVIIALAMIAVIISLAGFSISRMVNETRGDQEINRILGIFMSTRGEAMGNTRTYVVVLPNTSDRIEVYVEPNPGTFDIAELKNAINSGSILATLTQVQVYNFRNVNLNSVQVGTGGGSTTLELPVFLSFLPNGRIMVNDVSPIDVQNVDLSFRPQNGNFPDSHIVLYPYTGRMIAR